MIWLAQCFDEKRQSQPLSDRLVGSELDSVVFLHNYIKYSQQTDGWKSSRHPSKLSSYERRQNKQVLKLSRTRNYQPLIFFHIGDEGEILY